MSNYLVNVLFFHGFIFVIICFLTKFVQTNIGDLVTVFEGEFNGNYCIRQKMNGAKATAGATRMTDNDAVRKLKGIGVTVVT